MSTERKEQEPNPNVNNNGNVNSESKNEESRSSTTTTRTPFTNLSQVDADLALALTLQEQERAYMMLSMNNDGSDYGSWETGSYLHNDDDFDDLHDDDVDDDDEEEEEEEEGESDSDYGSWETGSYLHDDDDSDDLHDDEDEEEGESDGTDADDVEVFDLHAQSESGDDDDDSPSGELDPADFSSDEAYARALQDAEERGTVTIETNGHGGIAQDTWGEVVGTESRGLSADSIASLPTITYKAGNDDSCVICLVDFEEGESLTVLSCKHSYHPECINNWLKINKVCPVCSAEVST